MNRKVAYLIMLSLYVIVGIGALCIMKNPGILPSISIDIASKEAVLSAPESIPEKVTEPEEVVSQPTPQPEAPAEASEEVPEEKKEPQYTYTAIQRSKKLHIRKGPSLEDEIIGFLLPGDSGEVISIGEEWVYLKHEALEGYVFKEYLKLTEIE